jgi:hypothetical protein
MLRPGKKMNNLEYMEKIVSLYPELSWNGWDIVRVYEDESGYLNKNGVFINNKWHIKEVYKLENNGWNIPDRFIKSV